MGFGPGFGGGFGPGFAREAGDDTTPDAFLIGQRTNMPPGILIESAPFTVTGIDAASPWSVEAGLELQINGGAWSAAGGNVNSGDVLKVRAESSEDEGGVVSLGLTIGGVTGTFMIITRNESVVTPFPPKGGGMQPPRDAPPHVWGWYLARQKNRARRRAAQG